MNLLGLGTVFGSVEGGVSACGSCIQNVHGERDFFFEVLLYFEKNILLVFFGRF